MTHNLDTAGGRKGPLNEYVVSRKVYLVMRRRKKLPRPKIQRNAFQKAATNMKREEERAAAHG